MLARTTLIIQNHSRSHINIISENRKPLKLQAAKVVAPDLKRYVTLANPKQGHFTQASRIVSQLIIETVVAWNGQLNQPINASLSK